MEYWAGQFDMAAPFAAKGARAYFHAAAVANHILMFLPAVLSAGAFKRISRSENGLIVESSLLLLPASGIRIPGQFHGSK